jgi:hypothetical protein
MTLSSGGRLCLWDLARMRVLHAFELSARTKRRASTGTAKATTTYSAEEDEEEEHLDEAQIAEAEEAAAKEASADPKAAAAASAAAKLRPSGLAPRPRILTPESLQYSDSGRHFLVAEPGAVTVFDGSTGMQLCRMVHRSRVHCACFVPESDSLLSDGTSSGSDGPSWRVLSGCEDGCVRLWAEPPKAAAAASSSASASASASVSVVAAPMEMTEGGVSVLRQPLAVVHLQCSSEEPEKLGRVKRMVVVAGLKRPTATAAATAAASSDSAVVDGTDAVAAAAAALERVSAPSKITADTRALPAELIESGPLLVVTGSTGDVRIVSLAAVLRLSGSAGSALDGAAEDAEFAPAMGAAASSDAVSLRCPLLLRAASGYRSTCLGGTPVQSSAFRAASAASALSGRPTPAAPAAAERARDGRSREAAEAGGAGKHRQTHGDGSGSRGKTRGKGEAGASAVKAAASSKASRGSNSKESPSKAAASSKASKGGSKLGKRGRGKPDTSESGGRRAGSGGRGRGASSSGGGRKHDGGMRGASPGKKHEGGMRGASPGKKHEGGRRKADVKQGKRVRFGS